jgi:hypothetical protein
MLRNKEAMRFFAAASLSLNAPLYGPAARHSDIVSRSARCPHNRLTELTRGADARSARQDNAYHVRWAPPGSTAWFAMYFLQHRLHSATSASKAA